MAKHEWIADFETTTDPEDCRVWVWGVIRDDGEHFDWDTSIESFIRHTEQGGVYLFHNLAFDGRFIVDYLLNNGWVHLRQGEKFAPRNRVRQLDTMISLMGAWYQITFTQPDTGKRVTIRDSLKKLPFSVSTVAKAFHLDEGKGDIDYHKPRPVGYIPDADEIDYLRRDVSIIAKALTHQKNQGLTRLTIGSDALRDYQDMQGFFRTLYPQLDHTIDNDIRHAYRGGWTFANPLYAGKIIDEPGASFDVNSLYPAVMYHELLPYGRPEFYQGEPAPTSTHPLWIAQVEVELRLKPGGVPCVQLKNTPGYTPTEYITETNGPTTLFVSSVDWGLITDMYDVDVLHWFNGWRFRAQAGMFTAYIDKWMHVKNTTTGGQREIAKLMLNSLYGKFATNPDVTGRVPVLGEDRIVRLDVGPQEMRQPVYTAMGVFITSYAREQTVRAAHALGDRFLYADTDSLHVLGLQQPDIDVDPQRLGAWKHEYNFVRAKFLRAKCYVEQLSDDPHDTVVRIAGLPVSARDGITVDNLQYGQTFTGKLRPVAVPGGIVLRDVEFTIQ